MKEAFDIVHIVHGSFPDDPRVRREALVGSALGARVAVIALASERYPAPVGRFQKLAVVRLPGRKSRGSIARYLVEYFEFLIRARRCIARDSRLANARVVHVHTLPDYLIFAATPAKRRGARVILDLHEIFPEFTRSKFPGVLGRLGERVARQLERASRRHATVTVTVNRPIEALLKARPIGRDERIVVVHNVSDPREFGERSLTSGRIDQTLRLVYHGTLTAMYGLDLAVDAVHASRMAGADVRFDIYGDGQQRPALEAQIARLGLDGVVRCLGFVNVDALRRELPSYHAGLVPTRMDVMTRFSLSTKLLEYVHLGIPVIAPRIPTYEEYFSADSLWYFTPNESADAARVIGQLLAATPEERVRRASLAQTGLSALQWETEARRLEGLYRELLEQAHQPR